MVEKLLLNLHLFLKAGQDDLRMIEEIQMVGKLFFLHLLMFLQDGLEDS